MEVRTGKTLTALGVADRLGIKNLLFVTKKIAIGSIEADYKKLKPNYDLVVINYESLHKVEGKFDFVVLDEAHTLGAYPKPSNRAKLVRDIISKLLCLVHQHQSLSLRCIIKYLPVQRTRLNSM